MLSNNLFIYSAGVLPYAICNKGNVFFLLGKDYESNWCDFGGRCEPFDKSDPIVTAARECWEESLGSIYEYNYLKNVIKKSKYIESKTQTGYPYYMYLVKIPYSESYKFKFKSTRSFINNINIDRKYKEKLDVRWFSIENLNNHKGFLNLKSVFLSSLENNKDKIFDIIEN
jgi:hypothetical protein